MKSKVISRLEKDIEKIEVLIRTGRLTEHEKEVLLKVKESMEKSIRALRTGM
jgi:hypothetical protein